MILYFVVLSVISITIVSLFSIFEAKKGITNRTFSQLILLRDLRREQILAFFQTRSNELKSLAASEGIIQMGRYFDGHDEKDSLTRYLQKEKHMLDLVSDDEICKSLYFTSSSGKTISIKSPADNMSYFTEEAGTQPDTMHLSVFRAPDYRPGKVIFEQLDSQNSARIFIAVPLIDNDERYLGSLLAEILPEAIYRIMFNNNPGTGMGKTGEAYLVGADGLMRSPSRFVPEAILNVPVKTEGFLRAAGGDEGVDTYKDYRGVEILGAYGNLELGGVKRVILAEIDFEEAMIPLAAIRNEILFLSLIIVLVIFSLALFVAHGITRPLVRLKNAANFIALGNYNQQLEIKENDEIGELMNAFNAMASEINARKNLEAELAEERNKRIRAVIDGQDIERQRLSRELHDGLGQQLVAGKLILESSLYTANPDELKPKISEAQRIFDRIIGDIRRISHDLSPSILQEFGLRAAMENLCNSIRKTSDLQVDLFFNLADENPDEMTATYLFRIAQEGLNNAQRHSGATIVKVVLNADQSGILMEIEDNGCGFHFKEISKKGGNGLFNIRERVNILKGNLSVNSIPGKGTKILVRLPVNDQKHL